MAQRASDPPDASAVFERAAAGLPTSSTNPPVVIASSCRTTREVLAWTIATELGVRCYVAATAKEALHRLGLDEEGVPRTERLGNAPPRPRTMLLESDLLLEPSAGPVLCRALHELEVETFMLRGSAPRDVVAAERAAGAVQPGLREARSRSA